MVRTRCGRSPQSQACQSQEAAQSISLRPLAVVVAFLTLAPSFVPAANKAEPSLRGPAVPWPMGMARRNQASFPSSRCLGEEKTKPAASVFVKQSPWPRQPPQQASFGILVWVRDWCRPALKHSEKSTLRMPTPAHGVDLLRKVSWLQLAGISTPQQFPPSVGTCGDPPKALCAGAVAALVAAAPQPAQAFSETEHPG